MSILLGAVETGPLTSDLAGSQGIDICAAGRLAAVVHAQGKIFAPGTFRELGAQSHVQSGQPLSGSASAAQVPAHDPAGEQVQNHYQEKLRTVRKHERGHICSPELVHACCGSSFLRLSVHSFLDPGAEKVLFPEYPGRTFTAKLNISVLADESPNSSYTPGRVNNFEFGYPVFQGFIRGWIIFLRTADAFCFDLRE